MARRLISLPVALILGLSACSLELGENAQKLKWLDTAEAEAVFRADLKANRLRFFAVRGFVVKIPSVAPLEYRRCYKDVELIRIDGTGDALEGHEHARLNRAAHVFSRTYNLLMREHLDRLSGYSCRQL